MNERPQLSDDAVEAAANSLFWAAPWEVEGFRPPATMKAARELATAVFTAIDLPALLAEARAEEEAARTAEIVAWLRERGAPMTRPWQRTHNELADAVAAHFNPEPNR